MSKIWTARSNAELFSKTKVISLQFLLKQKPTSSAVTLFVFQYKFEEVKLESLEHATNHWSV